MKIISPGGGPEWSQHRDVDGSSSDGDSGEGSSSAAAEEDFTFTDGACLARTGDAFDDSQRESVSLQWRLPSHPFLVDLFTSFRKGGTHYLLMEWVEGGELFSTAKRSAEGRFGEEQARFYVAEALLALEHLHFHGVVYRDLRPENLLLDRKGHVKLTRPMRVSDAHERYSEFLAPEVLNGTLDLKVATANRVDWWSLGCIMYQMLVGVSPFSHPSVNVTAQRILHADYALPQGKFALSIPAADLLIGLLTRSPKKRFDVRQIKRHDFFRGIDWSKLSRKELKPSVRPFRRWQFSEALTESCSTSESTTSTTLSELLTSSRA
jgi:serine/threonine protein kinase